MEWLLEKIRAVRAPFGDTPEADEMVREAEAQALAEAPALVEGQGGYHPPDARYATARQRYDKDAGVI